MADTLLNAELLAACSALGYSDGAKYYKEPDCLETIKDLIRYLRKDDESHVIRRALGDTKVVQTDLIPLVCDYSDDKELFEVTLRLLVNLTNPVLLLFREELPEDKVTRNQFLQLLSQQQIYKEAFADDKVWAVLVKYLGNLLMLEWENRLEDDKLVVERILILIRNVLTVPANPETEKRTDDDASIHDQILWALHLAGFEDILLYVCSSENEQDLCMHALEIISLMLKEQDPTQLARAGLERSHSEKEKDEKELMDIRKREIAEKQAKLKKFVGARHSRFGGSFCVKNMKGISDRELITHQPLKDLKSLNFDHCKEPKKTPKHRMPLKDQGCTRRSTLAIRLFLQELCFEFLKGAYNSIMYIVKDNLNRARAQEHDETYYLWAMKFFMEFNRQYKFQVELVSETISVQAFHYIQTQLEHYYEMMTTDKKKIPHWSRRMHKALRAYQELLLNLASMDKSENESVRESSRILKSKVFYVIEYRELVLILLQNYDELKMSNSYLKDLVETSHIFLKLLEQMCGKHRHLMVQKKSVKKKKKKQKPKASEQGRGPMTEEQLREQWDEMAEEMGVILQGDVELPDTVPFDAASELTDDEQKEASMRKINALLRKKELKEGISLLRSSREVWPEGDIFGAQDIDPTQEFLALEEIFMANLNPEEPKEPTEIINSDEEEEDDEEEQTMEYVREQEFNFQEFVRRFANTRVMQSFYKLFRNFNNNSDYTNHCILKMFHRIGWDCKLPAMFFQASIFRVFQMAMEDPRNKSNGTIKEICKFAKFILRKFFEVTETNKKVFVELLFWKTNKEALEIECGYGTSESTTRVKGAWNEEEEDELQRLYEEFKDTSPEGKDGKDAVDMIVQNLINQNRTRRMVIKKLKDLGLVSDIKELSKKPIKVRAPKTWTEEEEGELKMLFEEYKESMDPITMIMDNMIIQRPKHRVVEKILELGLVADKKELRKKRIKKVEKTKKSKKADIGFQFLMANQNSDDEGRVEESVDNLNSASDSSSSDDDDENETLQTQVYVPPVSTPGLITAALNKVIENGMRESVQWISGILKEIADDREEDGDFEPIPLLAVTEESTAAMEDEAFQQLLKMIGIHPPVGHQEMFWRVPSRLTVEGLRKRVLYLKSGLEGQTLQDGNPDEPLEAPDVQKKSKKESSKINTKVTRMRKRHCSNDNDNKENEQMQEENKVFKPKASKPGKKRSIPEDSSDEDVPLSSIQSSGSGNHVVSEADDVETMSVKKVGRKRIMSDSEDDEPRASKKRAPSSKKAEDSVKKRKPKASGTQSAEKIQINSEDLHINKETQNFVGEMRHMTEEPLGDTQDLRLHLDTETQMLYGKTSSIKGNQTSYRSRIIDSDDDDDDIPLISQQAPKTIILEDSDNDSRKTVRKRIATIESDSD